MYMGEGKLEIEPQVDVNEEMLAKTETEITSELHLVNGWIHIIEAGMIQKMNSLIADKIELNKFKVRKEWLEGQLPSPSETK